MAEDKLVIIGFKSREGANQQLEAQFVDKGFDFRWVDSVLEKHEKLPTLIRELIGLDSNVLVLWDTTRVFLSANFAAKLDQVSKNSVLFPASSHLRFDNPNLYYFYWKHYPRPYKRYNFIDTSAFCGPSKGLANLLQSAAGRYPDETSLNVIMNRFYADSYNGCFTLDEDLVLDHEQEFFAVTQRSSKPKLTRGWMYELLYQNQERRVLKDHNLEVALQHPLNVLTDNGSYYQVITKKRPAFLITEPQSDSVGSLDASIKNEIGRETRKLFFQVNKKNKWTHRFSELFRFRVNRASQVTEATERIVKRLEERKPLSFAHYNDGELSFIRDYLKENHHNEWYGRKQQQYDPDLARRLYEAMRFQKEGYFVGVPCSVHHRRLRKLADKIVGDYEYKVQAMAIHHNLALMPRLLEALKGREVYFFTNEYQDLSFFAHIGVTLDPARVIEVPFRNSYLEYDKYKNMEFPEGAVVVLTCGMLAKILTKVWYETHESLTVLALGSSLDDHIQKKNIKFELYPREIPLAVRGGRPFLFGYKATCKECFNLKY
ncbi:MAG: hypothetical protein RIC30_05835 [Marinoscillum sp.]|uniref:hypothetical protein n=1 Tax=Marinoscillum sp. TaxID=2024838 RepID=UPI0032F0EDE9